MLRRPSLLPRHCHVPHYMLLKPKRHSLRCHGFVVHALLLGMHTNVVEFRVMRRLCHREWNWQGNWQSVNHILGIHDNGPRDHGVWRLTLTAYLAKIPLRCPCDTALREGVTIGVQGGRMGWGLLPHPRDFPNVDIRAITMYQFSSKITWFLGSTLCCSLTPIWVWPKYFFHIDSLHLHRR